MKNLRAAVTDVPAGPFDEFPFELGCAASDGFTEAATGDEIRARVRTWLTTVLVRCGVTLGNGDHDVIDFLTDDGWPVAQIIAGWVTRAHVDSAPGA